MLDTNALQLLKTGIEEKDFSKIKKSYELLTSTQVETLDNSHLQQILSLLSESQQERVPVENKEIEPEPEDYDDSLIQIETEAADSSNDEPLPAENSLLDVGEEEVFDEEEEKVLPKKNPSKIPFFGEEVIEDAGSGGETRNKQCVRVAFPLGPRKNNFKDNPAFAKTDTLTFDKKVRTRESIAAKKMIPKRQPSKKVVVRCFSCQRKYRIDAHLAPQRLGRDDLTSYQCDNCILSKRG
jgi:hypothetical protein